MTILVIDDEQIIRELAQQILERAGHDAILADSGESGLSLLEQQDRPVDLVIADYRMEGVAGVELLAQIRTLCPDLPIIVSSGIEIHRDDLSDVAGPRPSFLAKPYRPAELVAAVTMALGIPETTK